MKNIYLITIVLFLGIKTASAQYLGEIKMISGNVVPSGWLLCDGSLLNISQNAALYNILSTTYGGNGITTFALPDFRGRTPVGKSNTNVYGQKGGTETIVITSDNIPIHNHTVDYLYNDNYSGTKNIPAAEDRIASPVIAVNNYSRRIIFGFNNEVPDTPLTIDSTGSAGVPSPEGASVMQPYIAVNYIICNSGQYPFPPN